MTEISIQDIDTKLDTVETNANNYTHPTGNGNNHIPSGGSADQILQYSSAGTAIWADASGGGQKISVNNGGAYFGYLQNNGATDNYNAGNYLINYTLASAGYVVPISSEINWRNQSAQSGGPLNGYWGQSAKFWVNGVATGNSFSTFYNGGVGASSVTGTTDTLMKNWDGAYLAAGSTLRFTAGEHETQNEGQVQWGDATMTFFFIPES